ncbi:MAG: deoxyribonuclease IV [Actinobacteria bacterium]|nr:deoxyribonuclease IV [Actinomycetota bacterium]
MRIGAHVRRRAGGVALLVDEVRARGADCAQIFVSNPRGWAPPRIEPDEAVRFRQEWGASGMGPLVAHAPYLVNVASADPQVLERSIVLARATLEACAALGVDFLVVHAGTGGTDPHEEVVARAAEGLRVLVSAAGPARVLVELEEGIPAASASTVAEAARLFEAADSPTLGLCLDTCHLFAAGCELDTPQGIEQMFTDLRGTGLLGRLAVVHANDAMFERGSRRDRHENIGDGHIGRAGFRALLGRPEAAGLAFVLETPGDAERQARDIALLRAYGSSSARGLS